MQELPHLAVSSLGSSGQVRTLCQDASPQQLNASGLQIDRYVSFSAGFKSVAVYSNRSYYVLSVSLSSLTVSLHTLTPILRVPFQKGLHLMAITEKSCYFFSVYSKLSKAFLFPYANNCRPLFWLILRPSFWC